MKVLLVNDDGFGSIGITALLKACAKRGHEVVLVAPMEQQSAMSHRFTLRKPMVSREYPCEYPGCKTYALDGSPADCVRVGIHHLTDGKPDVVISGINWGWNSGTAVYYSGTFSAAMEGAFHYVPSVASSIHQSADQETVDAFADYTVARAEEYAAKKPPRGVVLNLNAPGRKWVGEKYCPLDTAFFTDTYERRENPWGGSYFWLAPTDDSCEPCDAGSDNDWLEKGMLTLSLTAGFYALPEDEYRSVMGEGE